MRECEFCLRPFSPVRRKQRTCGLYSCQKQRIVDNRRCRAADAADAHKARVDAGRKAAITRKLNARAR
jgi:hypothetical protein